MKIYQGNFEYASQKALELKNNHKEGLIIAISDSISIAIGSKPNTCNYDKINQLNYTIYEGLWNGGTCVVFPNDISLCMIAHNENDFGIKCLQKLQDFLKNKGIKSYKCGNDLIIIEQKNNTQYLYKVASSGSAWKNNSYFECVVHISMAVNQDLITQICTKPMLKKPKGLNDYNLNTNEILQYLKQKIIELQ